MALMMSLSFRTLQDLATDRSQQTKFDKLQQKYYSAPAKSIPPSMEGVKWSGNSYIEDAQGTLWKRGSEILQNVEERLGVQKTVTGLWTS